MSAQAQQQYPDPRKIENIDGRIVDLLNQLDDAYNGRLEAFKRSWRGLSIYGAATLDDIRAIENHIDDCIREANRRRI